MERQYESMMILEPDLTEQEQEEIFNKITQKITAAEGEVLNSKIWAKEKNFYFFLKSRGAEKKKYYKGCYWLIVFNLDTEKLGELKEAIRLEERILRNIIINREETAKAALLKKK
ncbi:MAG: 30S ribosomal protein S6 [Candidatus Omnitrophota bacterium]